jgi:TolB protein
MIHAVLAWMLLLGAEPSSVPTEDDRLGEIIVEPAPLQEPNPDRLPVLAIGVHGPYASATQPWFRVLRRDLELFGGFELRETAVEDDGDWLAGASAGVALVGIADAHGTRLVATVYDRHGNRLWDQRLADEPGNALAAHRLTDAVLEALTGVRGGFASRLAFTRRAGGKQHAYVVDVDGRGAEVVSRPDEVAVSPTFDTDGRLFYAASVDNGRYRIRVADDPEAGADLGGSVYGIAFSPDGARAAVTVERRGAIQLLLGTSRLAELRRVGDVELAMHPAFGPGGRLAYAGEVGDRPRVFVNDRAVSSKRVAASSPAFCHHPKRARLLWAERSGKRSVIVRADADGRRPTRISSSWGDARWPACSPDGRMIAFVSAGGGQQPGLYITHVEHFAPKRVSELVGGSLHWSGWQ